MQPELGQLLWHAAGFVVLVAVLKKFLWGPLLGVLDKRRDTIQTGLKEVEDARQEMSRLKSQYEQELARIEESARKKLAETVKEGQRIAQELEEEARSKSQETLAKAKESIELELAKARIELKDQIVDLSLEAVEKLLKKQVDKTQDRALIEEYLGSITKEKS
tara:strand:+ start:41 stop:529 length:489 start_codon:yes stop_codon:yes gene_type:complete